MKLSKTQVLGWVTLLAGLASSIGIDLPVEAIETSVGLIFDNATAGVLAVWGAVMVWLRTLTDSAVYKGLKGLLFKQDSGE